MEEQVFLLLGSNLGDRLANLRNAIQEIENRAGEVLKKSAIYQTAAWGKIDQPDFYNQVIQVHTDLSSYSLLEVILLIEKEMGRVRTEKWAARVIDIDVLYYGNQIMNTYDLVIPHPAIANRRFTLEPLAEVAPNFVHPVLQKSNAVLLLECRDVLKVEKVLML